MNFTIYTVIAVLITLFFVVSFIRQHKAFQLVFAIWVPSTLLQYLSNNRTYFNILSVIEIVLFVVAMVLLVKDQMNRKKTDAEENEK